MDKKDRIRRCVGGILVVFTGAAFQATGCNALTGAELNSAVNAATQGFLTSLFRQWIDIRIDGLLNVG